MKVRVTGTLADVQEDAVVLERDGIAWEVLIPRFALGELATYRGREVTLHTLEFLEGGQNGGPLTPRLIGFLHPEDKAFYRRFLAVKGMGPRKSLKAFAEPVARIATWIEEGDAKSLTQLPGIGKRAAELIIAQLRGKMSDLSLGGDAGDKGPTATFNQSQRDAIEVLLAWGDARTDVERWLERAAQLEPDIDTAEDWVRAAYRIKTGAAG